jgi:hypothetical protein
MPYKPPHDLPVYTTARHVLGAIFEIKERTYLCRHGMALVSAWLLIEERPLYF